MKKRYWGTYALAFIQLVFQPAVNLSILLAYGSAPGAIDTLQLFALPALMGWAVLAVRPWSFPIVVLSALMIFFRDALILSTVGAPLWLADIPLLVNLVISAYLLLPVLGSVRLDPQYEWFFATPSYRVGLPARISFDTGESLFLEIPVLSQNGAFLEGKVAGDCPELATGTHATLHTRIPALDGLAEISIPIEIAFARWRSATGISYGVRYLEMGEDSQLALDQLAQVLRSLGDEARYESDSSEEFTFWFWTEARGLWVALARDVAPIMLPVPAIPPAYSGKPDLRVLSSSSDTTSEPELTAAESNEDQDEPSISVKRAV